MSTTLRRFLKAELILGLMSGWSRQEKIEALNGCLTALYEAKDREDRDANDKYQAEKLRFIKEMDEGR